MEKKGETTMIFRSPSPDIEVPDLTLAEVMLLRADEVPEKPALIDGPSGRTLTHGQLALGSRLIASSLARRGFAKGDVFAIYSPNIPEFAAAFLAVVRLGGIVTTVNPLYTVDELAYQVRDTGARYLLTIPQFVANARAAAARANVEELFVFGEAEGATPLASLLASDGQLPDVTIRPSEDVVAMPYSSGTTGLPKGVMITHRNIVANIMQLTSALDTRDDDVVAGVLPFYHIYGLTVILAATLHRGGTIVSMPRFEFEPFLRMIQQYRITLAALVPPIVLALAKHPAVDQYDLTSLRYLGSGAAPLGDNVQLAAAERLDRPVIQGYGMTETSAATHTTPLDHVKIGASGVCLPNTECKIVDLTSGAELGPGEQGEICVRGPQIMRGYLNRPEETAAMLQPDGWLHTGDIGSVDADGYLFVVDRLKELIKYKGLQVAPAELEAVLLAHPAVADAAVVPVPDEEAGELPKAYVVLRQPVAPDELMAFVAERVAPHKRIRSVEVVGEIPKSASGKILRRTLIERERTRRALQQIFRSSGYAEGKPHA
jgi:acyl-CoA synthetase (AMP-forming)/AMP-acid ligase II